MKIKRMMRTPVLLMFLAALMVFSPLTAFAETESTPPTAQAEATQPASLAQTSPTDDKAPTVDTTNPEDASTSVPKDVEATEEVKTTEEKTPETKVLSVTDISALSADPTLHVEVAIENISYGLGTHPIFELTLGDKDLNLIAKVEGSATNYNAETGRYSLVFPLKSKLTEGETYYILLSSASPEIRDMEYYHMDQPSGDVNTAEELDWQSWVIKPSQRFSVTVSSEQRYDEETGKPSYKELIGSSTNPIRLTMGIQSDITAFYLKDTKGNPVKNQKFTILSGGKEIVLTSDAKGTATAKTKSFPNRALTVITEGRLADTQDPEKESKTVAQHTANLPTLDNAFGFQSVYLYYHPAGVTAKGEESKQDDSIASVEVTVSSDSGGNTNISQNWQKSSIDFKDASGNTFTFSTTEGANNFTLPLGTYTLTASSGNANVKLSKETITSEKGGKSNLTATLTPKRTLSVDRDGRDYSFKFLNVEELTKEFKGKQPTVFAVASGEVYMIEDISSGKVHTVVITSDTTSTKLVLGAGVVYGGTATTPHTGDDIFYLFGILVVCLILAGGVYVLHMNKQRKSNLAKQTLSVLLVFALLGGILLPSPQPVSAADESGVGIGGSNGEYQSGKKNGTPGEVYTSDEYSIIQVGFKPSLSEDYQKYLHTLSTSWDVLHEYPNPGVSAPHIFTDAVQSGMLYYGTTPESDTFLKSDRVSLYSYDGGNRRTVLDYGTDTMGISYNDDPSDGSRAAFRKRVIGYNDASNHPFIQLINKIVDNQGNYANANKIWVGENSSSNITFGVSTREIILDEMIRAYEIPPEMAEGYREVEAALGALEDAVRSKVKYMEAIEERMKKGGISYYDFYAYYSLMLEVLDDKDFIALYKDFLATEEEMIRAYYEDKMTYQNLLFQDYLSLLRNGDTAQKQRADTLELIYNDKTNRQYGMGFSMILQTVPVFYKSKGGAAALFPYHEATEWYVAGRIANGGGNVNPVYRNASGGTVAYSDPSRNWQWNNVNVSRQAEIMWGTASRGLSSGATVNKMYPTFSFIGIGRETFAGAIRLDINRFRAYDDPYVNIYPVNGAEANPTTGWGFVSFPPYAMFDNIPRYYTQVNYYEVNADGSLATQPINPEPVAVKSLSGLKLDEKDNVQGSKIFNLEAQFYVNDSRYIVTTATDDHPATIGVTDKNWGRKDNPNLEDNILDRFKSILNGNYAGRVAVSDSGQVEFIFGTNIPDGNTLYTYLGGTTDADVNGIPNKYYNYARTSGFSSYNFSDALITINVPVKVVCRDGACGDTGPAPTTSFSVPEWRFSKFFDGSAVTKDSMVVIVPPEIPGSYNGYFENFTGYHSLATPVVPTESWLQARERIRGDDPALVKTMGIAAMFPLFGDYLAIRSNSDVDNIRLASWLAGGVTNLHGSRITSTASGALGASTSKSVMQTVEYEAKPNYSPPTWHYTIDVDHGYTDDDGNWQSDWQPEHHTAATTITTVPAPIDVTVSYNRYIPATSTAQHSIQPATTSDDGLYTEVKPESTALNVNPEVAMLFSSSYSNSSALAFAAGDRMREVKPVTFNTIRYKNQVIDPAANGLSVATDKGATALASSLNATGKDVIYKGSATTNSVSAEGIVEFKTFALDIGQSSMKNAWNPGTTYSTQAINEEFLSRFLTRNATTGAWDALFNTNGKYLINNAEVAGVNGTKTVAQTGTTTAVPHTLEVRGGRLVRVDGSPVTSLSSELQQALTSMGIRTNEKGVFVQFESDKGATISGEIASNLNFVNAARHTSDWVDGENWYNEDSTVLVVWEYTTTFDIPNFEYSDKLPMSIMGIESPSDKAQFFSKGYAAHMLVRYSIAGRGASASSEAFMTANTQTGHNTNNTNPRFSVPNVSVQDTFSTVR